MLSQISEDQIEFKNRTDNTEHRTTKSLFVKRIGRKSRLL